MTEESLAFVRLNLFRTIDMWRLKRTNSVRVTVSVISASRSSLSIIAKTQRNNANVDSQQMACVFLATARAESKGRPGQTSGATKAVASPGLCSRAGSGKSSVQGISPKQRETLIKLHVISRPAKCNRRGGHRMRMNMKTTVVQIRMVHPNPIRPEVEQSSAPSALPWS